MVFVATSGGAGSGTLSKQVANLVPLLLVVAALAGFASWRDVGHVSTPSAPAAGRREDLVIAYPEIPDSGPLTNGLCGGPAVTIDVYTETDLVTLRLQYPNTTSVYLLLHNDIVLSQMFIMNASFACTKVFPKTPYPNTQTISLDGTATSAAVAINQTYGIRFYGININIATTFYSPPCDPNTYGGLNDFGYAGVVCPALWIWRSNSISISYGSIYGRVDLVRSNVVTVDSMIVFAPGLATPDEINYPGSYSQPGTIRISRAGDPFIPLRSGIIISNNDISGGSLGVLLSNSAVGVTIANNFIHSVYFAGVQCGQNVHNVADCMLNSMINNYIYLPLGFPRSSDAAGIYFDTHWYNPGNYLSCNYVFNTACCLYLDYCTSGVRVDGHVCYNCSEGLKLNTGKSNHIRSLVTTATINSPGFLNCQNYFTNNCLQPLGQYWYQTYVENYQSSVWNNLFPYLIDICSETDINGFPCNDVNNASSDQADVTGKCSGLPTRNDVEIQYVPNKYSTRYPAGPYFNFECGNVSGTVPHLNTLNGQEFTPDAAQFDDPENFDFGISDTNSPVYAAFPSFKSCPLQNIGIQTGIGSQTTSSPR